MYTVMVEGIFSAVHRLRLLDGTWEPPHGHDWHVRVYFSRAVLDEADMVIDFAQAQSSLQSVVAQLHHTDLNRYEAFSGRNPTAEVVAKHVFDRMVAKGLSTTHRVEVTEAPGCVAAFERAMPIESPRSEE